MGIQKLDQFLAGFIKTKIADKDGDGKLSKEEESIFKYSDSGKDLVDSLNFTEKGKYTGIDWSNVNDVLSENDFSRFTTDMAMSASQMMMKIDTDGNGQIFDNIDKDGNGTLSEEEIQAAIDSDMNLKNIFGIFGNRIPEGESAQNIFSFENMQRYAELVNISLDTVGDNRYTISDKEARSFGQLISSEETTINDETVSQERLLDIMQKYISTGFASAGADTSMLSELKHRQTRSVEYEKTVSGCTMSAEYEILPNGEKLSQIHFVSTINGHEYYIPAIEGLNPDDIVRISFLGDTTFAVQTSDNKVRLFRADTREVVDGKPVRTFKADDVETFDSMDAYKEDRQTKVKNALAKIGIEVSEEADDFNYYNEVGFQLISCKDKDGNLYNVSWGNGVITKTIRTNEDKKAETFFDESGNVTSLKFSDFSACIVTTAWPSTEESGKWAIGNGSGKVLASIDVPEGAIVTIADDGDIKVTQTSSEITTETKYNFNGNLTSVKIENYDNISGAIAVSKEIKSGTALMEYTIPPSTTPGITPMSETTCNFIRFANGIQIKLDEIKTGPIPTSMAALGTTSYTVNDDGSAVITWDAKMTGGSHTVKYNYDKNGHLTSIITTKGFGLATSDPSTAHYETYEEFYDSDNNVESLKYTDAAGNVTTAWPSTEESGKWAIGNGSGEVLASIDVPDGANVTISQINDLYHNTPITTISTLENRTLGDNNISVSTYYLPNGHFTSKTYRLANIENEDAINNDMLKELLQADYGNITLSDVEGSGILKTFNIGDAEYIVNLEYINEGRIHVTPEEDWFIFS